MSKTNIKSEIIELLFGFLSSCPELLFDDMKKVFTVELQKEVPGLLILEAAEITREKFNGSAGFSRNDFVRYFYGVLKNLKESSTADKDFNFDFKVNE